MVVTVQTMHLTITIHFVFYHWFSPHVYLPNDEFLLHP